MTGVACECGSSRTCHCTCDDDLAQLLADTSHLLVPLDVAGPGVTGTGEPWPWPWERDGPRDELAGDHDRDDDFVVE